MYTNIIQGIQQCKDIGFAARYVFLAPPGPNLDELEQRLRQRGSDDEDRIKSRLEIAKEEIEASKVEGFHDKILVNDRLDTTYDSLEKYIFGDEVVEGVAARESSSLSELGDGAAEALVTETSGEAPTEMES